jgi:hypothetical protein
MNKDRMILITLIQAIFYTLVWMYNDYFGTILSLVLACIALATMIISWIADRIEYAKVGKWYYPFLWISILIPVTISVLFWLFKGGELNWMKAPF